MRDLVLFLRVCASAALLFCVVYTSWLIAYAFGACNQMWTHPRRLRRGGRWLPGDALFRVLPRIGRQLAYHEEWGSSKRPPAGPHHWALPRITQEPIRIERR